ncbi:pseudouridine synthase [Catenulispora yoronensis]
MLAQAGVGSRRVSEDLIAAGRVEVDGEIVRHQGMRVNPETAVIRVDGMRISTAEGIVHFAFNKPVGVVSAMDDPERPNLGEYVRGRNERLFHVGRLDVDTEGLILLTNDGELAHRLAHPSYEIRKVYRAQVYGVIPGTWASGCAKASTWRTAWPASTTSGCWTRSARTRWSRSPSTRAATASCGASWTPSGCRCAAWCGPSSARSRSATRSRSGCGR